MSNFQTQEMIDDLVEKQNWDYETMYDLLMEFMDRKELKEDLHVYLCEVADEENADSDFNFGDGDDDPTFLGEGDEEVPEMDCD